LRIAQAIDATKEAQIKAHALALAELLYEESDPEPVKTLEGIEEAVRGHWLKQVGPEIGNFLSAQAAVRQGVENGQSKASSDN
jgi:hypothetical protein